jgi:signal transduction histidine kinase/CheY-like chemotaxis protein
VRRGTAAEGGEVADRGWIIFVHQHTGTLGAWVKPGPDPGGSTWTIRGTAGLRPIGDGRWHHVALVQRDTLLSAYVDGKLDLEFTVPRWADARAPGEPLRLGWDSFSVIHFVGEMDELTLWSRALSPREIRRLMYQAPVPNAPGLTAYWPFDGGKDGQVLDAGPNGYHGRAYESGHAASTRPLGPPFRERREFYALLVLVGLGALYGLMRLYALRIERQKRRLERLVAERTEELRQSHAETQRALETVAAQATRLRGLDEAKNRFFANVSHEFRTPLTLIVGPLEGLLAGRYGPLGAGVRGQHELMLRNGRRLLRMVNQILDLAKLESSDLTLDVRPRNLVAFVREATLAFAPLAERSQIRVAFHSKVEELVVAVDAEQLEKVLLNLLSNALKFTEADGEVEVTVRAEGASACVVVRDTGVGIPPGALPHVFERFFQADSASTRRHEGTGIGLALARELVELHGGQIHAESTPGAGSTFTVTLPLQAPATAIPIAAGAPGDATLGERIPWPVPIFAGEDGRQEETEPKEVEEEDRTTVLVVDDNSDVPAYIRSVLAPAYRVLEAADGVAGLALARQALPDLVVADVMMPGMDGLDLVRALKESAETDGIPVLLLTARATPEDQVEGLRSGAEAYLPKPFDPAVLEAQVASLLEQRRRLRARVRSGELPLPEPSTSLLSPFARDLRAALEPHLSDPDFSPEALAAAVGLSYQQLYRRLAAELQATPSQFIRTVRVERAAELLREGTGSITEVAYSVGFNSLSYFNRAFHERFGAAPSEYLTAAR